ncbi:hypothetical protein MPH_10979 [Macrophomina phaseolina MS6]|uniref:Uncharacterized protein n=1 Tax=Macrophomina phaseolina (strain MS6) TaxID=1126212 RepID=K2S5E3_MACPH|nr:hypothetical protein MPH_10979 [Macrophomina phaseolina MS6]
MVPSGTVIDSISVHPKQSGCSILSAMFGDLLKEIPKTEFGAVLSATKSSAVGVTQGSLQTAKETVTGSPGPEGEGEEIPGAFWSKDFAQLLSCAVGLTGLDVQYVETWRRLCGVALHTGDMTGTVRARNLRSLTLRGTTTRTDDLVSLLRRCGSVEELEFRGTHVVEGQWSRVFQLLSSMA